MIVNKSRETESMETVRQSILISAIIYADLSLNLQDKFDIRFYFGGPFSSNSLKVYQGDTMIGEYNFKNSTVDKFNKWFDELF